MAFQHTSSDFSDIALSQREIDVLTGWDLSPEKPVSKEKPRHLPPVFNHLGERPLYYKANISGSEMMGDLLYPAFFCVGEGVYFSFTPAFAARLLNHHIGLTLPSLQFTAIEAGLLQNILGGGFKTSRKPDLLEVLSDEAAVLSQTYQVRDDARVSLTLYSAVDADLPVILTSFAFEGCLLGETINFPLENRFNVTLNNEKSRLIVENNTYYITKETLS